MHALAVLRHVPNTLRETRVMLQRLWSVGVGVGVARCLLFVDNAAGLTGRHLDMLRSRNTGNPISEHTRPPRSRAAASLDLTPTATCLAFTTLPPVLRLTVCCGHALSRGAAVV